MSETKKKMRKLLWDGKLDKREVEIEITARSLPIQVFSQAGVEEMDPGISGDDRKPHAQKIQGKKGKGARSLWTSSQKRKPAG